MEHKDGKKYGNGWWEVAVTFCNKNMLADSVATPGSPWSPKIGQNSCAFMLPLKKQGQKKLESTCDFGKKTVENSLSGANANKFHVWQCNSLIFFINLAENLRVFGKYL